MQGVEEPVQESEPEVDEPEVDEPEEVVVPEEEEAPKEEGPVVANQKVKYKPYEEKLGTVKENGILLCIVLLVLILLSLGFLIYHEHTWRQEEEQSNVLVEPEFNGLRDVIRNYVKDMEDPDKAEYCRQVREVYLAAANSTNPDIDQIQDQIYDKLHNEIFEFEAPRKKTKYEYEWQKLFDQTGVINTWLTATKTDITIKNKKAIFTAIAEGLK